MNKYAGTQTEKEFESSVCRGITGEKQLYFFLRRSQKRKAMSRLPRFFEKTADNERAHAQMWGEELGLIGDTGKNRCRSPRGRTMSGQTCMRTLQKTAEQEGFAALAARFRMVGAIEKMHEERYRAPCRMCRHRRCLRKAV